MGVTSPDVDLRPAAIRVGSWLGWASIVAVLAGLAFDVGAEHRWLVLALTLVAAAANAAGTFVPWQNWLAARRGRLLLDLWCGGLIGFVAVLVVAGGPPFTLLVFLTIPFIAVVQIGWRRGFWLAMSVGACAVTTSLIPISAGATAMRLALVGAVAGVAFLLARTLGRAMARVELERSLAKEASHRIKNDLQTVADLLLLGRPAGGDGAAFDDTAARIRSIATVHQLLTEIGDEVDGGSLLRSIAERAPVQVEVEAEPAAFDAATAQKFGIVANELVTNAFQHGTPPIVVQLTAGVQTRLRVDDSGCGIEDSSGFGLELVRSMVEQGLHGRFELSALAGGGTRADVVFPVVSP
jgi:two-component sensor histidine kinase